MLFSTLLAAALLAASSSIPQELAGVLPRLSGNSAHECGVVQLHQDALVALTCAQEQSTNSKAFWVAVQVQGVDSQLWVAAAQAADGSKWLVRFDSDVSGGSARKKPLLEVIPCADLMVTPSKSDGISCPSDWRPWGRP